MRALTADLPEDRSRIYSVSQLNRETGLLLGEYFRTIRVEGEISNLSAPSSGHLYFSLKDATAQIRCAMFRNQQRKLGFRPENGKQVIVTAEVGLYEPRGDYQLIVEAIEEAGHGLLQRAFDALKLKLSQEGLFDPARKQPLPALPQAIGIVTTPTGAAIRDILSVLKRRFAAIPVIIYPSAVQGENAKVELVKAIEAANRHDRCDVLILARGGGSLEDLWAFNEEIVARAIFNSRIPVISGVGHETDVTIADFAADFRAATPTAAAEHATPDQQQWLARYQALEGRLELQLKRKLREKQQSLDWLHKRLHQQHPGQKLNRNKLRMEELELRLGQAMQRKMLHQRSVLDARIAALWQFNPKNALKNYRQRQHYLSEKLTAAMRCQLDRFGQQLAKSSRTLHAVSPLATLNRGYALAVRQPDGALVRSTEQLAVGDSVRTRVSDGQFTSRVTAIEKCSPFYETPDITGQFQTFVRNEPDMNDLGK
ncbi:exodeoxyribonuclease VII large subunit [Methylosarcina fibrata]|uniref:exodeoxyribonuclease VII large subunit n=1 Tax=Methylosarcina fibrata TaxID=105972 RepID=UPI00037F503A|nr:exodeoxyribonuclease VII large subunit [Methylosarcina fibrata]